MDALCTLQKNIFNEFHIWTKTFQDSGDGVGKEGGKGGQVNNTRSLVSMQVQTYNSYKRCFALLRKAAHGAPL